MSPRRARLVAGSSFVVSLALSAAAAVFLVLAWETPLRPAEFGFKGFAIAWSVVVGSVGAVLAARRPSNPIGWIFCGMGVASGVLALASEYARWALVDRGGDPPGGLPAAWILEWVWIPLIAGLGVVAAIFPDGRFISPGWRRVTWATIAVTLVPTVLIALIPELTVYEGLENPVGVGGDGLTTIAQISVILLLPLVATGTAAAVRRFRRSRGEERLQLKWLALSTGVLAALFAIYGVLVLVTGTASPEGGALPWLEALTILAFLSVPVSVAFGILKYRLYDIDIVINKTVVYGGLAAFVTGIYLVVVVAVGSLTGYASNPVLSGIAAAIVALAFQPARRRAQRLANRLVYGRRATPYEVLSELSSRFAGAYSLDDALPRLARVTAEAVGADAATVWLRGDGSLRPATSWPRPDAVPSLPMRGDDLPAFRPRETGFPVRHQGELLGAISVSMPASEPLGQTQQKLLTDVAAHVGLVLRNVALLEDLRASRKRIVTAQDERARKLERNIHDGAQQQLVALTVRLRLAQGLVTKDPRRAENLLGELQAETRAALDDLRDLARGIYPPLLADNGLRDALTARARKAPIPVRVDADGIGRYPQDAEAAVYFCALEAMANAAKHAGASSVTVRLWQDDDVLGFAVSDDGRGFDPNAAGRGTGLQGMADRIDAVGGELRIDSEPGRGTTLVGRIPVGDAS